MKLVLQVALDFLNLGRALKIAEATVAGGADWLEAGTPLIKSEGLDSVRALKKNFPGLPIVADLKIMDGGRIEAEAAFKAGASVVCVLGVASDSTIRESLEAARNYGGKIVVDLMNVSQPLQRAREMEKIGVDYLEIHLSIDEQMRGKDPWALLNQITHQVSTPLIVAGGINSETAVQAVEAGVSVVVVGGAVTKAEDPGQATRSIKEAIKTKRSISTQLFKRVAGPKVAEIFRRVSPSNLSDALHRAGEIIGLSKIGQFPRLLGEALTVRTYPGDWAKPVEAIDKAVKGQVIVVDAGGVGPAIWGELATYSALGKGVAGVVIDGGIRDVVEIERLNFPAYARVITPAAGEPKGFGEIGVPIKIRGKRVLSGDWLVGDEDGLVVIPKRQAAEIANRAMDVLERENRIRREIKEGGTLSSVMELLRWEKT